MVTDVIIGNIPAPFAAGPGWPPGRLWFGAGISLPPDLEPFGADLATDHGHQNDAQSELMGSVPDQRADIVSNAITCSLSAVPHAPAAPVEPAPADDCSTPEPPLPLITAAVPAVTRVPDPPTVGA